MKAVLIDVSHGANRFFHTPISQLTRNDGEPVGVLLGLVREWQSLSRLMGANTLAFCFDSKNSKRREIFPEYKKARKDKINEETEEQQEGRKNLYTQINLLPSLLREAGCLNILEVDGYEADDLAAGAVRDNPHWEFTIVSGDEDLFQLLQDGRVDQYRRGSWYTEKQFRNEYGISPTLWASAKSWAGCSSDGIQGIRGIGNKKASQFLAGKSKKPEVFTGNLEVYNFNIRLTKLPFTGLPEIKMREQLHPIDWGVLHSYIDPGFSEITGV